MNLYTVTLQMGDQELDCTVLGVDRIDAIQAIDRDWRMVGHAPIIRIYNHSQDRIEFDLYGIQANES